MESSSELVPRNGTNTEIYEFKSNTRQAGKPEDLLELAKAVEKADHFTKANAHNKLAQIVKEIRRLQDDARQVLEDAKRDSQLNHVECNIQKRPGQIYHVYERLKDGTRFFSMLSPAEWGNRSSQRFLASYRLEYDFSWTPASDLERRDEEIAFIDKILAVDVGSFGQKALKNAIVGE